MFEQREQFTERIEAFARERGFSLPAGAAEDLYRFAEFLLARNEQTNLTALRTWDAVLDGHILDSLAPAAMGLIPDGARILDVGCGPGLPGIPLRLALENSDVTLLDSQQKRVRFIEEFIQNEKLSHIRPLCERAEKLAAEKEFREKFDIVVSRAVAQLPILCELCLPFVRPGGVMLAYKGRGAEEEAAAARGAISTLGGGPAEIHNCGLGGEQTGHCVVMIEKIASTANIYPRKYAKILKNPL